MNRMFDDFWLEPFGMFESWPGPFVPSVDVTEDEKEVRISAELPGMDENDIEVTVTDNTVTIRGEKKEEEKQEDKGFFRRESSYGTFRRMVRLPAEIDENQAQARFKKGVLKIVLPKTAEAKNKSRKIDVKGG